MFDVGFSEIIFVFILAIIVLGPERLPEAGKKIGHFFRMWNNTKNEWNLHITESIRKGSSPEKINKPVKDEAPTVIAENTDDTK